MKKIEIVVTDAQYDVLTLVDHPDWARDTLDMIFTGYLGLVLPYLEKSDPETFYHENHRLLTGALILATESPENNVK